MTKTLDTFVAQIQLSFVLLTCWLSDLFRQTTDRYQYAAPRLEWLESRLVPATYHWSGNDFNSANMSSPANWTENPIIPGIQPGDILIFDGRSSKNAVADPGLPGTIAGMQFTAPYLGNIIVTRNLTVANLEKTSAGDLAINGNLILSVQSGSVTAGTVSGATFQVGKDANDQASFSIGGATFNVTHLITNAASQLVIVGDLNMVSGVLENRNKVNWASGNIGVGGTINNLATFTVGAMGATMNAGGTFDNRGLLVVDLGLAQNIVTILCTLDNVGGPVIATPLEVKSGQLAIAGTFNSSAPVKIESGARLNLTATSLTTSNAGTRFDGTGTLSSEMTTIEIQQETTLQINSQFQAERTTVNGWQGGPGNPQPATLVTNSAVTLNRGKLAGLIVTANQGITFASNEGTHTLEGVQLQLSGTSTWSSGDILVDGSAILNTGTFDIQGANRMRAALGQLATLVNGATGAIHKTGGNQTQFDVTFSTAGNMNLNGRQARFAGGIVQTSGIVDLGNQGSIDLLTTVGGQGDYRLEGGQLKGVGTTFHNGNILHSGGTLNVKNSISIDGDYIQAAGATLVINATANNTLSQVQVTGTGFLAGALVIDLGAFTIDNGLDFNILTAGDLEGSFASISAGWEFLPPSPFDVWIRRNNPNSPPPNGET